MEEMANNHSWLWRQSWTLQIRKSLI